VYLHAAWFILSIAAVPPLSSEQIKFMETWGLTYLIFAGRALHLSYEPIFLKALFLADVPALLLAEIPLALILIPIEIAFHISTYAKSYVAAACMLLVGSCQWLLIGGVMHARLESRKRKNWFLQMLKRHIVIVIALIVLFVAIATAYLISGPCLYLPSCNPVY
jgi:hypothetical protein